MAAINTWDKMNSVMTSLGRPCDAAKSKEGQDFAGAPLYAGGTCSPWSGQVADDIDCDIVKFPDFDRPLCTCHEARRLGDARVLPTRNSGYCQSRRLCILYNAL